MKETNRDLLSEVIEANLKTALSSADEEERKVAFKQAMEAIDRQNAINKNDDAYSVHSDNLATEQSKIENEKSKLEFEKDKFEFEKKKFEFEKGCRDKEDEFKREEAKKAWLYRGIEIGVIYGLHTVIDMALKRGFARDCMRWEENQTFSSTPGRTIKDFFRFKH